MNIQPHPTMKTTTTTLFMLLLMTMSYGRPKENIVLKSALEPHMQIPIDRAINIVKGSNEGTFLTYDNIKYVLDSVVREGVDKQCYAFDDSCNLTLDSYYTWHIQSSQWFLSEKQEITYNSQQKATSEAYYYGDSLGHVIGDYKRLNTYNTDEDSLQKVEDYYWENNAWKSSPDYVARYTYRKDTVTANVSMLIDDFEMLVQQIITIQLTDTTNTIIYLYRPNDNPDTMLYSSKYDYTYNSNDDQLLETKYVWNANTTSWTSDYQRARSYDENNYNTGYQFSYWNDSLQAWQLHYSNTYTADENYNPQTYTYRARNEELDSLINSDKSEFTYDDYRNRTSRINYTWDLNNNEWKAISKAYDYSYDFDVEVFETLLPESLRSMTFLKIDSVISESLVDDVWVKNPTSIYHYSSPQAASIPSTETATLRVYPNPTTGSVHIELPSQYNEGHFSLWNINGQCLMNQMVTNNEAINLQGIANGYYLCKIKCGNTLLTQKLIVQ